MKTASCIHKTRLAHVRNGSTWELEDLKSSPAHLHFRSRPVFSGGSVSFCSEGNQRGPHGHAARLSCSPCMELSLFRGCDQTPRAEGFSHSSRGGNSVINGAEIGGAPSHQPAVSSCGLCSRVGRGSGVFSSSLRTQTLLDQALPLQPHLTLSTFERPQSPCTLSLGLRVSVY